MPRPTVALSQRVSVLVSRFGLESLASDMGLSPVKLERLAKGARALSTLGLHMLAAHVDASDVAEIVIATSATRPSTISFALGIALARITTTGDARGVDRLEPAIWLLPRGEA